MKPEPHIFFIWPLDILSAWETRWGLEFNPSKCQVVCVTGFKKTVKTDYELHGQVFESVLCARYLGVDISSGLTWNSHVDRVTANDIASVKHSTTEPLCCAFKLLYYNFPFLCLILADTSPEPA